ncbi:hypothetical protein FKP32DRAFT_1671451 [Trametes sanguinea]|nr:hypothetical protein FKP32DRAFT_1671451 [Trametes sanguinea]
MRERIERTLCRSSDTGSTHSSSRSSPGHASEEFLHGYRSSSFQAGGEAIDHGAVSGTKRANSEQGDSEVSTEGIAGSKRLRTISQRSAHQDDSLFMPPTNHVSSPHQPSSYHQTALAAPAATFSRRHHQTSTSATQAAATNFGQPDGASISLRLPGNYNGTAASVDMPSSTVSGHWHVHPNAPLNPLSSGGTYLAPSWSQPSPAPTQPPAYGSCQRSEMGDHTGMSVGDATRAAAPHPGRPDAARLSEHLPVAYPASLGEPSYSAAGYSIHNAHEYLFESNTQSSAQSASSAFTKTYTISNPPFSYPPAPWSQPFAASNQSPAYPSYLGSETDDVANRLLHPSWQGASTLSAKTPKNKSLAGIEEMRTQGTAALLSCNNSASCPNAPAFSQRISSLEHLAEDAVLRSMLDAPTLSAEGSSAYSGGEAPSATFDTRERQGSLNSDGYSPGFSPFSSGEVSPAPTTPENAVYAPVPSCSLSSNAFAPAYNLNRTSGSASSPAIELLLARETLQQAWGFGVANDLVLGRVPVVADDFNALGLQYGRSGSGAEPSPTELAAEWIRKPIERPGDSEWEVSGGQDW